MNESLQTEPLGIEGTEFGAGLSSACRRALAELAEPVHVPGGRMLFREGERNENVYLLLKGRVDLAMSVPGRGSVRILSLEAGDIVAWSAVLGNSIMTCSAMVVEDADLMAMPGDKLRQLMKDECCIGAEFAVALGKALSKRLLATRLQLLDLFAANC